MARDDIETVDEDEELEDEELDELEPRRGPGGALLVGLVIGVLVGAGAALLLAPERGDVLRDRLQRRMRRLRRDAGDRVHELRDDAERELRRTRRRIKRHLSD